MGPACDCGIHPSIHPFIEHLLSTHYMPATVLDAGDRAGDKTKVSPALWAVLLWGGTDFLHQEETVKEGASGGDGDGVAAWLGCVEGRCSGRWRRRRGGGSGDRALSKGEGNPEEQWF